jgi:hypothetical protein
MEQVEEKVALFDLLGKISIGGTENSYIDLSPLAVTDTPDLSLLQDSA